MRVLALVVLVLLGGCSGDGGGFIDASRPPPPADPGRFSVSWAIADGQGAPLACADAGAVSVHVDLVAGGAQFAQSFACDHATGITGALTPATYDLTLTLLDVDGAELAKQTETGVALEPATVTSVPQAEFTVAR